MLVFGRWRVNKVVGLSYKEKIEHTPCRDKPYKKVDIGDTVGRLTLVEELPVVS